MTTSPREVRARTVAISSERVRAVGGVEGVAHPAEAGVDVELRGRAGADADLDAAVRGLRGRCRRARPRPRGRRRWRSWPRRRPAPCRSVMSPLAERQVSVAARPVPTCVMPFRFLIVVVPATSSIRTAFADLISAVPPIRPTLTRPFVDSVAGPVRSTVRSPIEVAKSQRPSSPAACTSAIDASPCTSEPAGSSISMSRAPPVRTGRVPPGAVGADLQATVGELGAGLLRELDVLGVGRVARPDRDDGVGAVARHAAGCRRSRGRA